MKLSLFVGARMPSPPLTGRLNSSKFAVVLNCLQKRGCKNIGLKAAMRNLVAI